MNMSITYYFMSSFSCRYDMNYESMTTSTLYPPPNAFVNGRLSNRASAILTANGGLCFFHLNKEFDNF